MAIGRAVPSLGGSGTSSRFVTRSRHGALTEPPRICQPHALCTISRRPRTSLCTPSRTESAVSAP